MTNEEDKKQYEMWRSAISGPIDGSEHREEKKQHKPDQLKQGLTKDNFWLKLNYDFPKGTKIFYDWIDYYKAAIGFENIVKEGVKFHDLPYAMQFGIWHQFSVHRFGISGPDFDDLKQDIYQTIKMIDYENKVERQD